MSVLEDLQKSLLELQIEHQKRLGEELIRKARMEADKAEWECKLARLSFQAGQDECEKRGIAAKRVLS